MSLLSLLNEPDVRKVFKEEFPRQAVKRNHHPLAPPKTGNNGLVGTAFDYLLRFYLKRLNPKARCSDWIAEKTPNILESYVVHAENRYVRAQWAIPRYARICREKSRLVSFNKNLLARAKRILDDSKKTYDGYLRSGRIDRHLITSALCLAQLDSYYRANTGEYDLGSVDELDIEDLWALTTLVKPSFFKAKKLVVLNPTFGAGSRIVGGADADILLDDAIIEIKTTKDFQVRRESYNQLIGYYLLSRIGGIDGVKHNHRTRKLAIYFSRFGEFYNIDVNEAVDEKRIRRVIFWFLERAGYSRRI